MESRVFVSMMCNNVIMDGFRLLSVEEIAQRMPSARVCLGMSQCPDRPAIRAAVAALPIPEDCIERETDAIVTECVRLYTFHTSTPFQQGMTDVGTHRTVQGVRYAVCVHLGEEDHAWQDFVGTTHTVAQ